MGKVTEQNLRDRLSAFAEEHKVWVVENFGEHGPGQPFLGVVEEIGELREAETTLEKVDAIGDVLVFTADVCQAAGINFVDTVLSTSKVEASIPVHLGRAAHAILKTNQHIRGSAAYHRKQLKAALAEIVCAVTLPLEKGAKTQLEAWAQRVNCLEMVWGQVRLRDWNRRREEELKASNATAAEEIHDVSEWDRESEDFLEYAQYVMGKVLLQHFAPTGWRTWLNRAVDGAYELNIDSPLLGVRRYRSTSAEKALVGLLSTLPAEMVDQQKLRDLAKALGVTL